MINIDRQQWLHQVLNDVDQLIVTIESEMQRSPDEAKLMYKRAVTLRYWAQSFKDEGYE